MVAIKFNTIWENFPSDDPCVAPGKGTPPSGYDNQCAMRVGYALEKSGVSFSSFQGKRCPYGSKSGGLIAGAQELANWLGPDRFSTCPKAEVYSGKNIFEKIDNRTGIIFLANYWQRSGETGNQRSGDHIDLWNGSRMTKWLSYFRVHYGISWDGTWSDFRGASKAMFWHIQ